MGSNWQYDAQSNQWVYVPDVPFVSVVILDEDMPDELKTHTEEP